MKRGVFLCLPVAVLLVSLSLLSCGGGGNEEAATTGPLDGKFGKGGKVTTAIGTIDDEAFALAIQPDGKLVAAGYSNTGSVSVPVYEFALVRYNTDGTLDPAFGTNGVVTTSINGTDDRAFAVVVQPDGKIVAAGYSNQASHRVFALVRYNTDGTPDTAFGTGGDGIVTTNINAVDDEVTALAIYHCSCPSDGNVAAAGYSYYGGLTPPQYVFAVARYNPDGSLDGAFNPGGGILPGVPGIVTTRIGTGPSRKDQAFALAVQGDKLVAAGTSTNAAGSNQFALVRYAANGNLDTSFGAGFGTDDCELGGCVATTVGGGGDDAIRALVIQPDNKLVAAGYSNGIQYVFAVARYDIDGTLDPTFGLLGGVVTTAAPPLGKSDFPYALAIQSTGKLVAAGRTNTGNQTVFTNKFALVRYNTTGSLDNGFGSKGIAVTPINNVDDEARALVAQPDGKLVAAGKSYDKSTTAYRFALIRYSPMP